MPPVSIVTVNRGPPAAVWGYLRYQYLQVHMGPGNPWDGAASSACACLCTECTPRAGIACSSRNTQIPLHVQTHAQGPRPWRASPPMGWEIILLDMTCSHSLPPPSLSWCREVLGRWDPLYNTHYTIFTDHVLGIACGISCSPHSTTGEEPDKETVTERQSNLPVVIK